MSLKIRRWLPNCFKKKFSYPQVIFWTNWLQFWLPCRKHLPNSELVLFNQLQNFQLFFRFFFLQKILRTSRIPFSQLCRFLLPKIRKPFEDRQEKLMNLYSSKQIVSGLTTILKTLAEFRKRFDQPTAKNSAIFQIFYSTKDPPDT